MGRSENEISGIIVDAAIKVHRVLGPGLLESVYMSALAIELRKRGLRVLREVEIRSDGKAKIWGLPFARI